MRFALAVLLFFLAIPSAFCQEPSQPSQQDIDPAPFCATIGQNLEHPEALADACRYALSLKQRLPNVICDQTTTRYLRPAPGYFGRRVQDVLTAHVIYEDGRERYSDLKVNGKPQDLGTAEKRGQYTTGEFGTDLIFAFTAPNHPSFRYLRKDSHAHHHTFVYESMVRREDNHGWVLATNGRTTYPEFAAEISVDQTTHEIVRFQLKVTPEKDFPLSNIELQTQYEDLPLGDGTRFVLPTQSGSESCLWNSRHRIVFCNENVLEFKNCHKFRARSKILADGVTGPQ
jgi:hypothetical protein